MCFDTMYEMFGAICSTFEYMLDPNSMEIDNDDIPVEWDRETRVKAQGLLSVMKSSSFFVAFVTAKNLLEIIKPLTVKLQKPDIDIVDACNLIDSTEREVKDLRAKIGNENFSVWFKDVEQLAVVANTTITPLDLQANRDKELIQNRQMLKNISYGTWQFHFEN